MSPLMIRGGCREPETGPGFGLLPGTVIDQHFRQRGRQDRLLRVLAANPGLVGIGIDEGAALLVQGNRLTVMGDSCVVTLLAASADSPEEVTLLQPGEEADLARLDPLRLDSLPADRRSHTHSGRRHGGSRRTRGRRQTHRAVDDSASRNNLPSRRALARFNRRGL